MTETISKLRTEIQGAKGYRHEFVLKKFAFGAGLLGLGSVSAKLPNGTEVDFLPLAYLVPLIALTFDLYIVVEDYRIKRAGEFIRVSPVVADKSDRAWEEFAHENPNHANSMAFGLVTFIYLVASTMILLQAGQDRMTLTIWAVTVIVLELAILGWGLRLRAHLSQAASCLASDEANTVKDRSDTPTPNTPDKCTSSTPLPGKRLHV